MILITSIFSTFFKALGGLKVLKFVWEKCLRRGEWKPKRNFTSSIISVVLLYVVVGLAGTAYVLARMFVVVEVLKSLFFLPPGAFESTIWVISLAYVG